MTERLTAWQCIGCGKIESPRPCIGVCEDRRRELVYADEHDAALALVRHEAEALAILVRQIAHTMPRKGECERTWLALQARARAVLDGIRDDGLAGRK